MKAAKNESLPLPQQQQHGHSDSAVPLLLQAPPHHPCPALQTDGQMDRPCPQVLRCLAPLVLAAGSYLWPKPSQEFARCITNRDPHQSICVCGQAVWAVYLSFTTPSFKF